MAGPHQDVSLRGSPEAPRRGPAGRGETLLGFGFAVVVALVVFGVLLPRIVGVIRSGASDLDARLQAQDVHLRTLCAEDPSSPDRQGLCSCVLATERPALDCNAHYQDWALGRQALACQQTDIRDHATSYCACVETVAKAVAKAEPGDRLATAQRHERCLTLDDARPLP